MNKYLMTLFFLPSCLLAQGLSELFLALPDSAVLGLNKSERQTLWQQAKPKERVNDAVSHQDSKLQLVIHDLDIANGYMGIAGNRFEGDFHLCYWSLPKGQKLIATYRVGYATFASVEQFSFYSYNPSQALSYIPSTDLIPDVEAALFIGEPNKVRKALNAKDYDIAILYDLPQRGKDILVRIESELTEKEGKAYLRGNRMILSWDNGKFRPGKVYWAP